MTLEDYNALHEILSERHRESERLNAKIEEQAAYIREAEAHLKAVGNSEPEDKKVFSPRRQDPLYKEEIRKIKEKKALYEDCTHTLRERKAVVDCQIATIITVLEHQKKDFTVQISLKDLEDIIDKIERSSKFIDRNPTQARQDFVIIAKSLREIVEGMRDTME